MHEAGNDVTLPHVSLFVPWLRWYVVMRKQREKMSGGGLTVSWLRSRRSRRAQNMSFFFTIMASAA